MLSGIPTISLTMEEKFDIIAGDGDTWVAIHIPTGIELRFKEGHINDAQEFYVPPTCTITAPTELAKIAREIAEWLRKNHYELIFNQ